MKIERLLGRGTRAWAVMGGQAGSEGKGKVAAWLAKELDPDIAVSSFGPNAGHSVFLDNGHKIVVKQVPIGCVVNDKTVGLIGAGSIVSPEVLLKEIKEFDLSPTKLRIDPRAAIVTDEHKVRDRDQVTSISSTLQGVGPAIQDRVARKPAAILGNACPPELKPYLDNTRGILRTGEMLGKLIQLEGCQGYDLDLFHGIEYPYVTSRPVTFAALCSDVGFPPHRVGAVVLVLRTYPIRVGNTYDEEGNLVGYSGPYPTEELDWGTIGKRAGYSSLAEERTTVTGKVRRVFEFSPRRAEQSAWVNGATHLVITFADYLDARVLRVRGEYDNLDPEVRGVLSGWARHRLEPDKRVLAFSTGPRLFDMVMTNRLVLEL